MRNFALFTTFLITSLTLVGLMLFAPGGFPALSKTLFPAFAAVAMFPVMIWTIRRVNPIARRSRVDLAGLLVFALAMGFAIGELGKVAFA